VLPVRVRGPRLRRRRRQHGCAHDHRLVRGLWRTLRRGDREPPHRTDHRAGLSGGRCASGLSLGAPGPMPEVRLRDGAARGRGALGLNGARGGGDAGTREMKDSEERERYQMQVWGT
jgi:hypothetical protein